MSIPLHSITTRSSSSSPTREEIDHEYLPQEDTAGLTADVTRTATATTQQSIFTRIFSETWTSEILCWLLALLSLVIIIIILAVFHGQPLANWHSRLTLNTLISIGSQIAQTAVFVPVAASNSQLKWIWYSKSRPMADIGDFDKASRGPIDGLLLSRNIQNGKSSTLLADACHAKSSCRTLVYLGALNTSLVLLLGSFAQQSVSLPLRPRNSTSSIGSIPIARQYQAYLALDRLPMRKFVQSSMMFFVVQGHVLTYLHLQPMDPPLTFTRWHL